MGHGDPRDILSNDPINLKPSTHIQKYERSSARDIHLRAHSRGDLGQCLEIDCPVEKRAKRATGLVHLPGHF